LSIKERFDLWEKLPNRDVMDFPIGQLTEEQYHDVLDKIGVQRRAISLMWNQRSVDTFLGLPFNIASYGLLLEIIAKEVNMVPDELIGNLGDTHLYLNHIEQAKEQIGRTPFELPKLRIVEDYLGLYALDFDKKIDMMKPSFFILENYQSHPKIVAPLSN
jgi:thymidylate synthase